MTCNKQCEQGRDCDCDHSADRSFLVVCAMGIVLVVALGVMVYGLVKLVEAPAKGTPCEIEVQFKDSKATYIGRSV